MIKVRGRARDPNEVLAEAAERAQRIGRLGLRPTDEVRFRKTGRRSSWLLAIPHDINSDGSVACFSGGQFRSIRPERLEVKRRGPRGGTHWVPLTTPEEAP